MNPTAFTRRDLLRTGGALVISFMMPGAGDCYLTAMADAELH